MITFSLLVLISTVSALSTPLEAGPLLVAEESSVAPQPQLQPAVPAPLEFKKVQVKELRDPQEWLLEWYEPNAKGKKGKPKGKLQPPTSWAAYQRSKKDPNDPNKCDEVWWAKLKELQANHERIDPAMLTQRVQRTGQDTARADLVSVALWKVHPFCSEATRRSMIRLLLGETQRMQTLNLDGVPQPFDLPIQVAKAGIETEFSHSRFGVPATRRGWLAMEVTFSNEGRADPKTFKDELIQMIEAGSEEFRAAATDASKKTQLKLKVEKVERAKLEAAKKATGPEAAAALNAAVKAKMEQYLSAGAPGVLERHKEQWDAAKWVGSEGCSRSASASCDLVATVTVGCGCGGESEEKCDERNGCNRAAMDFMMLATNGQVRAKLQDKDMPLKNVDADVEALGCGWDYGSTIATFHAVPVGLDVDDFGGVESLSDADARDNDEANLRMSLNVDEAPDAAGRVYLGTLEGETRCKIEFVSVALAMDDRGAKLFDLWYSAIERAHHEIKADAIVKAAATASQQPLGEGLKLEHLLKEAVKTRVPGWKLQVKVHDEMRPAELVYDNWLDTILGKGESGSLKMMDQLNLAAPFSIYDPTTMTLANGEPLDSVKPELLDEPKFVDPAQAVPPASGQYLPALPQFPSGRFKKARGLPTWRTKGWGALTAVYPKTIRALQRLPQVAAAHPIVRATLGLFAQIDGAIWSGGTKGGVEKNDMEVLPKHELGVSFAAAVAKFPPLDAAATLFEEISSMGETSEEFKKEGKDFPFCMGAAKTPDGRFSVKEDNSWFLGVRGTKASTVNKLGDVNFCDKSMIGETKGGAQLREARGPNWVCGVVPILPEFFVTEERPDMPHILVELRRFNTKYNEKEAEPPWEPLTTEKWLKPLMMTPSAELTAALVARIRAILRPLEVGKTYLPRPYSPVCADQKAAALERAATGAAVEGQAGNAAEVEGTASSNSDFEAEPDTALHAARSTSADALDGAAPTAGPDSLVSSRDAAADVELEWMDLPPSPELERGGPPPATLPCVREDGWLAKGTPYRPAKEKWSKSFTPAGGPEISFRPNGKWKTDTEFRIVENGTTSYFLNYVEPVFQAGTAPNAPDAGGGRRYVEMTRKVFAY